MFQLGVEPDGPVGASALGPYRHALVEGTGVVPRKAQQDGVAVDVAADERQKLVATRLEIRLALRWGRG